MNEIESDDLVATLESLIDKFGEEMAPYSVALCQRLVLLHIIFIIFIVVIIVWNYADEWCRLSPS